MRTHNSKKASEAKVSEGLRLSETRYRRLFESARDGILILDADTGEITDANPFMTELLGYTREEFLGMKLWQIGLLEDKEASIAAFEELQNNNYIRYEDLPLETKDGQTREVEFVSNVYLENETRVIQCNVRDITHRKDADIERIRLAAQIKDQHQRLRNVIANVPGVVWESWTKPDHSKQHDDYVSSYVETMLGYTVEEWLATPDFWLTIVHPDDKEKVKRNAARNFKNGHEGNYGKSVNGHNSPNRINEFRWITKDGRTIWVEAQTLTIKDDAVEAIGTRGVCMDITGRKIANRSLRKAEAQYRSLVESSPAIIYLAKPSTPFTPVYISPNISDFGFTKEEWILDPDKWVNLIHKQDRERVLLTIEDAMKQGRAADLEYRITLTDGTVHWLHEKGFFVLDESGNKMGWQGIILDVTPTKELEQQLRQAQKLESIGLLAGGIAHDFNNMLTAINGYCDLSLRQLKDDDPIRRNIEEVKKAGLRSADLTYQLLAFSRKLILMPVLLDINVVITETVKMLGRVIGEDIQIISSLDSSAGSVMVDPGQFAQIIMNLAVNARDSMPGGGKLTIKTSNFSLSRDPTRELRGFHPGEYVLVSVTDTGIGMSPETIEHIFDPFFTTKAIGSGTGLGLATLYGIVHQSGGQVEVESKKGVGTTFKIYLPRIEEQIEAATKPAVTSAIAKGTETIFLVEDEPMVGRLLVEFLEICGYKVIQAHDGQEALDICEKGDCDFQMLITDVVMPNMGGRVLSGQVRRKFPNVPILFMSGYTDENLVRGALALSHTSFIQKPFAFDTLVHKVREMLDAAAASPDG